MWITRDDVMNGALKSFEGHTGQRDVKEFKKNLENNIDLLYGALIDGTYIDHISYRELVKVNNDGKTRKISSPSLVTRIYQHTFIWLMKDAYDREDPKISYNCKDGYGITSNDKEKSLMYHIKELYFDKRHYKYCLIIDQRHCYEHITEKLFRSSLKYLTSDKSVIDFGVHVCMHDKKLPIGTPTSPFVHHVCMLGFDKFVKGISCDSVRFADDNLVPFDTKEEAQQAKWRIKNYWWYVLGIRAKHNTTVVIPFSVPRDFCGFVYHRNMLTPGYHNKGYVTIRNRIAESAKKVKNNKSWGSYFGLLKNADCYSLMWLIEEKDMKLSRLTDSIKINRSLDAENIDVRSIEGKLIEIIDYEIRSNKGVDNWIKCLIGIEEVGPDNRPTGKILAREFHGNYQGIIQYLREVEKTYKKEDILPLEDVTIINQCGYIFKDSTNQLKYIEENDKKLDDSPF